MSGTRHPDKDKKEDKPKKDLPYASNDSVFRLAISNKLSVPLDSKAEDKSWWIAKKYLEYWERGNPIKDKKESPLGYPALANLKTGEIRCLPCRNGVPKEKLKTVFLDKYNQPFEQFLQTEEELGNITGNVHIDLANQVGWTDELKRGELVGVGIFKGVYSKIDQLRGNSANANALSIEYASEILEEMSLDPSRSHMPGISNILDNLRRIVPDEILKSISESLIKILPGSKEKITVKNSASGKTEEVEQTNDIRIIKTNPYLVEYKKIVAQKFLTKPVNQLFHIYQNNGRASSSLFSILEKFILLEKRFKREWIGEIQSLLQEKAIKEKACEDKEARIELKKEINQKLITVLLSSLDVRVTKRIEQIPGSDLTRNILTQETPIIQVINRLVRKLELNEREDLEEDIAFLGWLIKQKNYNLEQELRLYFLDNNQISFIRLFFYCSGYSILAKLTENDKELAAKNPFHCAFIPSEYPLIIRLLNENKLSAPLMKHLMFLPNKGLSIYRYIIQSSYKDNFPVKEEIPQALVHIIKEKNYDLTYFTEEERSDLQEMLQKNPSIYFACILKDPEFLNIEFFNQIFFSVKRLYQLPIILEEAKHLPFGLLSAPEAKKNYSPFSTLPTLVFLMSELIKTPHISPIHRLIQITKISQQYTLTYAKQPYRELLIRLIKAYHYDFSMLFNDEEKYHFQKLLMSNSYQTFIEMILLDPTLYDHSAFRDIIIKGHEFSNNEDMLPEYFNQIDYVIKELNDSKNFNIEFKKGILTRIMNAINHPELLTFPLGIFSIEMSGSRNESFRNLGKKYFVAKAYRSLDQKSGAVHKTTNPLIDLIELKEKDLASPMNPSSIETKLNNVSISAYEQQKQFIQQLQKDDSSFSAALKYLLLEIKDDLTSILTKEQQKRFIQKLSANNYQLYIYLISRIPYLFNAPLFFNLIKSHKYLRNFDIIFEAIHAMDPSIKNPFLAIAVPDLLRSSGELQIKALIDKLLNKFKNPEIYEPNISLPALTQSIVYIIAHLSNNINDAMLDLIKEIEKNDKSLISKLIEIAGQSKEKSYSHLCYSTFFTLFIKEYHHDIPKLFTAEEQKQFQELLMKQNKVFYIEMLAMDPALFKQPLFHNIASSFKLCDQLEFVVNELHELKAEEGKRRFILKEIITHINNPEILASPKGIFGITVHDACSDLFNDIYKKYFALQQYTSTIARHGSTLFSPASQPQSANTLQPSFSFVIKKTDGM